jgi:hypothetical protein
LGIKIQVEAQFKVDDTYCSEDCIVIEFLKNRESVEVSPQSHADLPFSLIGRAAIWDQLAKPNKSTYHLCHSYDNHSFPAIKYINHDWYYLYWDNGKYYTRFQSHILTPISLGLGTHQMLSIDTLKSAGDSE